MNKSLHISKRLYLDDWLLLFACSCLTAATVLLLYATPTVYLIEATSLNPIGLFGGGGSGITDLDTLLRKINFFARFNWIYLILSWTTIFAVKFGFLSFFRNLVLRLPSIHRYWRVVVAVTAVVYLFSLIDGVIACPHDGLIARMLGIAPQPRKGYRFLMYSTSILLRHLRPPDWRYSYRTRHPHRSHEYALLHFLTPQQIQNLTKPPVLAIPLNILWRVKMQTQQKLGLAAFLCLQVLMIIIAVIRISGFIYRHAFDEGWVYLWQQIESCVSVSTISLTAFRIMFVAGTSRREQSPRQWSERGAWRRRVLGKKNSGASSSTGELDDVSIPGARLEGMRTVIGRAGIGSEEEEYLSRNSRSIHVMREHEVNMVCSPALSPTMASTITHPLLSSMCGLQDIC